MATTKVDLDIDGRTVTVSSLDKPYFAELGLTKGDVIEHFRAVGPGILAALKDRPTTMERWPGGWKPEATLATRADGFGDAFYQKRVPKGAPDWVSTATITFPSGRTAVEVAPSDLATVIWMVNLGTLRFHPWPVSRTDTEIVDQLRIDLDPQPGTDFADAVRAAGELHGLLDEWQMPSWVKTSGGRGVHVFVPIRAEWDFIDARHAVIAIGRELERRMPDHVTTAWWKEERGERVFVDFNQMARDRTMASAYSIRPGPQARVSTPVTWDELPETDPDEHTVRTSATRFAERGDVWESLYSSKGCGIETALEAYERDARDHGLGEMPYPPEYPKMPGEPARVQPSRKAH
ncbi:MAG TPA: DNA polymerase domain-containing protein [Candidatus Avipropionibacterium avicola]|uniref:DNA polymerase domain-containing protein n=1 Tax=Candidatus Avipropionibacterium avicola TaxID=2840701 RepID=A0A9D1GZF2_9ACTN|nr:DNA polymerase domain-containing protein [Candidatus Avipropionibacterium avicola]